MRRYVTATCERCVGWRVFALRITTDDSQNVDYPSMHHKRSRCYKHFKGGVAGPPAIVATRGRFISLLLPSRLLFSCGLWRTPTTPHGVWRVDMSCGALAWVRHVVCSTLLILDPHRNPLATVAVQFDSQQMEESFIQIQFPQQRLFNAVAISLPSYIAQLAPGTHRADLALRGALALWALTSPRAHQQRWHRPVLVVLRLWLSILPVLVSRHGACDRSLLLGAICGNSIVYPLILQLPFTLHIPLAFLGLCSASVLATTLNSWCATWQAVPRWAVWVLPDYPAPPACAQALVALHGCAAVMVSTVSLWCVMTRARVIHSLAHHQARAAEPAVVSHGAWGAHAALRSAARCAALGRVPHLCRHSNGHAAQAILTRVSVVLHAELLLVTNRVVLLLVAL